MIVVEQDEYVDELVVEDRPDGAVVVRLDPENYEKLEAECSPGQSVAQRVKEIVPVQ